MSQEKESVLFEVAMYGLCLVAIGGAIFVIAMIAPSLVFWAVMSVVGFFGTRAAIDWWRGRQDAKTLVRELESELRK